MTPDKPPDRGVHDEGPAEGSSQPSVRADVADTSSACSTCKTHASTVQKIREGLFSVKFIHLVVSSARLILEYIRLSH